MIKGRQIIKVVFLSVVGLALLPTIGFSAWAIGEKSEGHGVLVVDDAVEDVSSGLSVEVTALKMGKYYYESIDGSENSEVGYLVYTIGIVPADLPSSMKGTYGEGYRFTFAGTISFSDERASNLFSSRHFSTTPTVNALTEGISVTTPAMASINTSTTEGINYMAASISAFTVTTSDRGSTQQKFSFAIEFRRSLLLDTVTIGEDTYSYQTLLKEGSFIFHLSGSAA